MITLIPANIEIPWEGLENGALFNDDGHGFAVASTQGITIGKSMDYYDAAEQLVVARKDHGSNSIVLFHSRWATHGELSDFNIHPFWVGKDTATVVAHNGILPKQYHPSKKDRRSDTRVFVDQIASAYTDDGYKVPSRRGGKALGTMIGSANKLVFLSAQGSKPKARIINSHRGVFTEGVWYSNDGYLPSRWTPAMSKAFDWQGWSWIEEDKTEARPLGERDNERCPGCGALDSVDKAAGMCTYCETCIDCNEWIKDCLCYVPESARQELDEWERANEQALELWKPTVDGWKSSVIN